MSGYSGKKEQDQIQSFMVSEGNNFGDLLSHDGLQTDRKLKIGLLRTSNGVLIGEMTPCASAVTSKLIKTPRSVAFLFFILVFYS